MKNEAKQYNEDSNYKSFPSENIWAMHRLEEKANTLLHQLRAIPEGFDNTLNEIFETDLIILEDLLVNLKALKKLFGEEIYLAEKMVVSLNKEENKIVLKTNEIEVELDKESYLLKETHSRPEAGQKLESKCFPQDHNQWMNSLKHSSDPIEIGIVTNLAKLLSNERILNSQEIKSTVKDFGELKNHMKHFFTMNTRMPLEYAYLILNTTKIFQVDLNKNYPKYKHLVHFTNWILNSAHYLIEKIESEEISSRKSILENKKMKKLDLKNYYTGMKNCLKSIYANPLILNSMGDIKEMIKDCKLFRNNINNFKNQIQNEFESKKLTQEMNKRLALIQNRHLNSSDLILIESFKEEILRKTFVEDNYLTIQYKIKIPH